MGIVVTVVIIKPIENSTIRLQTGVPFLHSLSFSFGSSFFTISSHLISLVNNALKRASFTAIISDFQCPLFHQFHLYPEGGEVSDFTYSGMSLVLLWGLVNINLLSAVKQFSVTQEQQIPGRHLHDPGSEQESVFRYQSGATEASFS